MHVCACVCAYALPFPLPFPAPAINASLCLQVNGEAGQGSQASQQLTQAAAEARQYPLASPQRRHSSRRLGCRGHAGKEGGGDLVTLNERPILEVHVGGTAGVVKAMH